MKKALKIQLLFFLFIFVLSTYAQDSYKMPFRGICAHRGARDTHPENTISAFTEAVRLGVQMIELDVRLTKDEQLVILHDPTVNRTTNGHGNVSDLLLAEIKKLDAGSWKSEKFKGEKIPDLKEALSVIPGNIWVNVHLKGGRKLGEKVALVLAEEGKTHQAFLACGKDAAAGAHSVDPGIMICNMDRQESTEKYVHLTLERKAEFIQLYNIKVEHKIMDATAKLKSSGIRINYCCTDNPEDLKKLFDYGVDFILVNEVAKMMKVADSLGIVRMIK